MHTERLSGSSAPDFNNSGASLRRRVLRVMITSTLVAMLASLFLANAKVTAGLFVGGALSLLNFYWMGNSIAAAFSKAQEGFRPKIRIAQYVLRYFLIAVVVATGYKLNFISLPATIIGLSSFVVALFAEAFRESYFIITHREGIN
jgi:hypothetical protein